MFTPAITLSLAGALISSSKSCCGCDPRHDRTSEKTQAGIEVTEENVGGVPNFTELAGEIVAAYVSNNPVPPSELPKLIQTVHSAVVGLASGVGSSATTKGDDAEKLTPAQIRKSVRDDGIVSFIDGKTYKTLKRHLSSHGLDPRSYRDRYGLPADYPMVAPSYAAQRSALARAIGLGRLGTATEAAPQARRKAAGS
ncbi:MucR family transcriptional regulator [Methylobacterium sp. WL64]|nr:MucR family transcriptional regulator [Methylobacterium sp. WL64]TXN53329.1 MucR family transcriptional regulator [Methylobacterium sp. WL2]